MAKLTVKTNEKRFPVAPMLYGLFFEDINRSGDSGLYPEMLRNRAFDDSVIPSDLTPGDDGWLTSASGYRFAYHNGEGFERWIEHNNDNKPTPIPAWYAENAQMRLDREQTLNAKRETALSVSFSRGGHIWNIGYAGVPAEAGKAYNFYMFARVNKDVPINISFECEGKKLCVWDLVLTGNGYIRYDNVFVPTETTGKAKLVIEAPEGGDITFGFMSLMPASTFRGHGLRLDLAQKLEDINPAFVRFPGGCIVEGMSDSTAMRFSETVGPVWERRGHINVWEYRMTDGLGFHEYMQLCEDLGAEALYVCNCGMTCQARQCILFEGEALDTMLEEALSALEYALGPADSRWGALRARMGHPEPFKLNYFEIGNENSGDAYLERYRMFRDAIIAKYPHLKIVANTHVEDNGLPLDIADEHFYNQTEWFARNTHFYDKYDRKGPEIFVGEFAVTTGQIRTLYPAVGEAMFMIGMERNQDIVKLASYAPLFENINYALWNPNLIVFDNLRSHALPSYYVWRLFGLNRGSYVVSSSQETGDIYVPYIKGGPVLMGVSGTRYRNALWNGQPVSQSREVLGHIEQTSEGFTVNAPDDTQLNPMMKRFGFGDHVMVVLGDDSNAKSGVFEVEVLAEEGREISLGICCSPMPRGYMGNDEKPEDDWSHRNLRPLCWNIKDGQSSFTEGSGKWAAQLTEATPLELMPGEYHAFKMINDGKTIVCYLDGELICTAEIPHYESIQTVATDDGDKIIIKIANIADHAEPVEINLDCSVASEYKLGLLTGDPTDRNTLSDPEKVRDVWENRTGASSDFVYEAPAYSVNVLLLRKA